MIHGPAPRSLNPTSCSSQRVAIKQWPICSGLISKCWHMQHAYHHANRKTGREVFPGCRSGVWEAGAERAGAGVPGGIAHRRGCRAMADARRNPCVGMAAGRRFSVRRAGAISCHLPRFRCDRLMSAAIIGAAIPIAIMSCYIGFSNVDTLTGMRREIPFFRVPRRRESGTGAKDMAARRGHYVHQWISLFCRWRFPAWRSSAIIPRPARVPWQWPVTAAREYFPKVLLRSGR